MLDTKKSREIVGSAVGSWVWNFKFDLLMRLGTLYKVERTIPQRTTRLVGIQNFSISAGQIQNSRPNFPQPTLLVLVLILLSFSLSFSFSLSLSRLSLYPLLSLSISRYLSPSGLYSAQQ
eukprot:sb/3476135/